MLDSSVLLTVVAYDEDGRPLGYACLRSLGGAPKRAQALAWIQRKYAACGTYLGAIDYVANWYDKRYEWLDDNL